MTNLGLQAEVVAKCCELLQNEADVDYIDLNVSLRSHFGTTMERGHPKPLPVFAILLKVPVFFSRFFGGGLVAVGGPTRIATPDDAEDYYWLPLRIVWHYSGGGWGYRCPHCSAGVRLTWSSSPAWARR